MTSTKSTDFDRFEALKNARTLLACIESDRGFREPSSADMEATSITLDVVCEALWKLLWKLGDSPKPQVELTRKFRLTKRTIKRVR